MIALGETTMTDKWRDLPQLHADLLSSDVRISEILKEGGTEEPGPQADRLARADAESRELLRRIKDLLKAR